MEKATYKKPNMIARYFERKAEERVNKRNSKKMRKEAKKKLRELIPLKDRFTKKFVRKVIVTALMYFILFDLAFVFLYPFITMIIDALKTDADLVNSTVKWIPSDLEWKNFSAAADTIEYWKFFKNSAIVALAATLGHVIVAALVGYGLARYKFPGRGIIFAGVVLSMLVPVQVLIFPLYKLYGTVFVFPVNWLDTYLPLIVPCFLGFGLRGGFYIFLFRQFFMGLPWEMEEAARIDGCGPFSTFFRIMLPMSRSSILVSAVLSIVWHWNDYFEPNIYLNQSPSLMMLPSRLKPLYELLARLGSENSEDIVVAADVVVNQAVCMAATFLVILPLLLAYMFVQKQFMEGVERSGLTGM